MYRFAFQAENLRVLIHPDTFNHGPSQRDWTFFSPALASKLVEIANAQIARSVQALNEQVPAVKVGPDLAW